MAKIELYFGNPTTEKEWEMVEAEARAGDICIESAVIQDFYSIVKPLLVKTKNDENYFELVICGISGILVTLPAITMGAYKHNGFVLPKMTIHGDYAVERKTHQRIVISKEWIDGLGQEFEYKWNFEYFDFKIIGKVEAQKNEVIYLLTNKPHVYRSGRFIETRR
jgi:mannose-6-phosphate isomerase class I